MRDDIAVVVLAGGEGLRIGGAKPLRRLRGERLIDRAARQARGWSDAVAVALRRPGQLGEIEVETVIDETNVAGPLAGLIAALKYARERGRTSVLTIPADTPFLPPDLPMRLDGAIGGQACALASSGGRLHPACGLWRASAFEQVEAYLATGRRSLNAFAELIGYVAVEWPGGPADPFFNINTADELAQAELRWTD